MLLLTRQPAERREQQPLVARGNRVPADERTMREVQAPSCRPPPTPPHPCASPGLLPALAAQNDVEGSVADFDAALAARPAIRPYLWQRGLSLYYLQQYEEGAQQAGAAQHLAAPAAALLTAAALGGPAHAESGSASCSLLYAAVRGGTTRHFQPAAYRHAALARSLPPAHLPCHAAHAVQFRDDVAVNPNDTEESIWAFLCEAQLAGPETARQQFLQVRQSGRGGAGRLVWLTSGALCGGAGAAGFAARLRCS